MTKYLRYCGCPTGHTSPPNIMSQALTAIMLEYEALYQTITSGFCNNNTNHNPYRPFQQLIFPGNPHPIISVQVNCVFIHAPTYPQCETELDKVLQIIINKGSLAHKKLKPIKKIQTFCGFKIDNTLVVRCVSFAR